MTPHLDETHAAVSLSRACASSKLPCIRTQCSASLHPIRSNASAIVGETPACPFSSRDSVFRVTPRRSAHWATVQPLAWMLSRISSPGCDGLRMDISNLLSGSRSGPRLPPRHQRSERRFSSFPETRTLHCPRRSPLSWCGRQPGRSRFRGERASCSAVSTRRMRSIMLGVQDRWGHLVHGISVAFCART